MQNINNINLKKMLEKTDTNKKTFINIVGGRFAVKCTADTEGAVKRFSEKKKEDVYELVYDSLTALIKEMKISKTDYGKFLELTTDDGEQLSIPVESKYFDAFCSKIGNADLSKDVKIVPFSFESDGKKFIGLNIYQDGSKLEYFYSKEDPKGKPYPASDKLDEADWKIFKLQERKFFCEMIENLSKAPF